MLSVEGAKFNLQGCNSSISIADPPSPRMITLKSLDNDLYITLYLHSNQHENRPNKDRMTGIKIDNKKAMNL